MKRPRKRSQRRDSVPELPLTDMQAKFVEELPKDWDWPAAARRAGYSKKGNSISTRVNGLRKHPAVQLALEKDKKRKRKKADITEDLLMGKLHDLITFDVGDLYKKDGTAKELNELDDHTRKVVGVITSGKKIRIKGVMTVDQLKAIQLAGKQIGMFRDKHDVSFDRGDVEVRIMGDEEYVCEKCGHVGKRSVK